MLLQQVPLTNPTALQGLMLSLPRWPGMAKELQRRQLSEQTTGVVRHLNVLSWLEHALRIARYTSPVGGKQQWRLTLIIGVAHEMIEHGEPIFIRAHLLVRRIPLTQDVHCLGQPLFPCYLSQRAGSVLADHIRLMKMCDLPLGQDRVGKCYTETGKIELRR
ncbi:hypothetical protein D3C77_529060 [compost metagenome]